MLDKGTSLSLPLQVRPSDLSSCDITIKALSINMHEKPHCAQIQKAKYLEATRVPLDSSPCSLAPITSLSRNPQCSSCFPAAQTTLHCTSSCYTEAHSISKHYGNKCGERGKGVLEEAVRKAQGLTFAGRNWWGTGSIAGKRGGKWRLKTQPCLKGVNL